MEITDFEKSLIEYFKDFNKELPNIKMQLVRLDVNGEKVYRGLLRKIHRHQMQDVHKFTKIAKVKSNPFKLGFSLTMSSIQYTEPQNSTLIFSI